MENINNFVGGLLKDKKVTQEQVDEAEKLLTTDLGLLTVPNAEYLYGVGIIDREGRILYKLINKSAFKRPLQLWSLFCLIKHDIKEYLGFSDLNAIVDVMRNGETEGDRKYPKVMNFIEKGSQLAVESISRQSTGARSRSKRDDFEL